MAYVYAMFSRRCCFDAEAFCAAPIFAAVFDYAEIRNTAADVIIRPDIAAAAPRLFVPNDQ